MLSRPLSSLRSSLSLRSLSSTPMDVDIAPGSTRIGWIGTGVMGSSMCSHLIKAGYETTIFSRTASKCAPLVDLGATLVDSPKAVAERSDVVFSIVGLPSDVRSVILGEEGIVSNLRSGGIVVDMTTSEPSLAEEIAKQASSVGIGSIDAPVSGGDIGAKNATLSVMIGGEDAVVKKVMPLFELMGKNLRHAGGPGRGQHTKMVNQILISTNMIGMVEGLLYAQKAGLDLDDTILAVGAGAAGSWSINNLGPRIAKGNFDPGFFVEHFLKDLGIALEESKKMGLSLPGLALAHQLYLAVQAQGHGRLGTHALYLALAKLNGMDADVPSSAGAGAGSA